jgi:AraC-like DNA-binding protein
MASRATVLSSWPRTIKKTLDLAGLDGLALVREAGLDPKLLDNPNARYPVEQTTKLWRIAARETGDPCFGLKVASQVAHGTFHALSYSIAPSLTLRDAFERMERYSYILSDAALNQFRRERDGYHFILTPQVALPDETVDAFVSLYVRMCRSLSGDRKLSPKRIELRRARPGDTTCFEKILRAPLRFGAARNALVFAHADLDRPLESGNRELAREHDEIARRALDRVKPKNTVARVELVLLDRLPRGEPSQADVAAVLFMSARTLQRKLAEDGTTYKEILDDLRRKLALSYLAEKRYSASEIAYLLGFSDASSFTRAFRRWTGMAPSKFRKRDPSLRSG